jgi:hypothetical protein
MHHDDHYHIDDDYRSYDIDYHSCSDWSMLPI